MGDIGNPCSLKGLLYINFIKVYGGGGGIRTHGRLSPTSVFKTGAFNHSATPPTKFWLLGFWDVIKGLSKKFYIKQKSKNLTLCYICNNFISTLKKLGMTSYLLDLSRNFSWPKNDWWKFIKISTIKIFSQKVWGAKITPRKNFACLIKFSMTTYDWNVFCFLILNRSEKFYF